MTGLQPPAWETLDRGTVFESQWMQVVRDTARSPGGDVGVYDHVLLPPSVTVLAVRNPPPFRFEVAVTRQWIYTHGGVQWRLPAGGVGPDESPVDAAARELREEVGAVAERLTLLGRVHGADSATNHVDYLYLARGLTVGEQRLEPQEADLTVLWVPLREAVTMARGGGFLHAGSVAAVLLGADLMRVGADNTGGS